ncbi:MAG: hypothetical protein HUU57_10990 [Bdellovibrio sp.]|nr:hypothetical protein [Bdellovibrio sp.]
MKHLLFIFAALLVLNTTQALAANLICVDNFTKEFPGTLFVVTEDKTLKNIYHAEKISVGQSPRYIQVQGLTADPANIYSRDGGIYAMKILTSQGLLVGKLSVNSLGDELTFKTSESEFILSCQ